MQNDEKSKSEKVPSKRGRKKKIVPTLPVEEISDKNNIEIIIEEISTTTSPNTITEPTTASIDSQPNNTGVKKRGRKPSFGIEK